MNRPKYTATDTEDKLTVTLPVTITFTNLFHFSLFTFAMPRPYAVRDLNK